MTDRAIRTTGDLDAIAFDKGDGLVPVVVQDTSSGAVLMTAYANREALEATLRTGEMHFWSRSRGELWRKGETSGNTLGVQSLHGDCDSDAILALVTPTGPACHTGEVTCFGAGSSPGGSGPTAPATAGDAAADPPHPAPADLAADPTRRLEHLDRVLAERASLRPPGSYTVRLLDDPNLRLKKLGEETAELVAALATGDRRRAIEETADLVYHALVALRAEGADLADLVEALNERAG